MSGKMIEEELYMSRCIQLARNGVCSVSPNPMVGAVIVYRGKIIGEGYHVCCGCEHAEVNAIRSVKDPSLLQHSTLYVTLEPCSHHGKTPPCADLIIKKQIPKVVIGCIDPFSKVAGRGIDKLRNACVRVEVGILEDKCRKLVKSFVTFNTQKRPYIVLKWAQSCDGYIDSKRENGSPVILSNDLTAMLVHKRRAEVDAILVGTRTALLDNPSLTVRNWFGNSPVRVVIDKELSLPQGLSLFDGTVKTFVITAKEQEAGRNVEYLRINFDGDVLSQIMHVLYSKNIQSLLVEGGRMLLQSFIDKGLWDEIYIEKSPAILVDGIRNPVVREYTHCSCENYWDAQVCHLEK